MNNQNTTPVYFQITRWSDPMGTISEVRYTSNFTSKIMDCGTACPIIKDTNNGKAYIAAQVVVTNIGLPVETKRLAASGYTPVKVGRRVYVEVDELLCSGLMDRLSSEPNKNPAFRQRQEEIKALILALIDLIPSRVAA